MAERENFLSRWSRRKQAVTEADTGGTSEPEPASMEVLPAEDEPFDPASLPPVESLTADSDFSLFLRKNVPEALRNAALRRLWAFDPHLQGPDVLADYAWDFNAPELATGFGELAEGTDTQAMLRWIRGEELPPGAVTRAEDAEAPSLPSEAQSAELSFSDSPSGNGEEVDAALQHQEVETTEEFGNQRRIRRHGGALPN